MILFYLDKPFIIFKNIRYYYILSNLFTTWKITNTKRNLINIRDNKYINIQNLYINYISYNPYKKA